MDFSNALNSRPSDGAPRGQYPQPNIPAGTKILATFKLHDVPFCFDPKSAYIAKDTASGLLKFFFELSIRAPQQYSGQKLGGSKMLTEAIQHQMGITATDYSPCARGDRAVHAILACDAFVKNRQPQYNISNYRQLDGLTCAVIVGEYNGKTCIKAFLDPSDSRDRDSVQKLLSAANTPDPGKMPDVPNDWPSPDQALGVF